MKGTEPVAMIESEAKRVETFLVDVAGSRANLGRNEALGNALGAAIEVDKLAKAVKKARGARRADLRAALANAENDLAGHIQTALNSSSIAKLDEGYLLEGMVAAYGAMPRESGDKLTPDHQPQNGLMLVASYLRHAGSLRKLFARTRFGDYRTADGWAINLRHERHVWGETYGVRPRTDEVTALRAAAMEPDLDDARRGVLRVLRASLKIDATAIEKVVKEPIGHDAWSDLRRKLAGESRRADREALRLRIQKRVLAGETKLREQPFEDFLRP
jgi:hypothetical protein